MFVCEYASVSVCPRVAVESGKVTAASCPPAVAVALHCEQVQVGIQEQQIKLLRQFNSHFVRSKLLARYASIQRPCRPATARQLYVQFMCNVCKQALCVIAFECLVVCVRVSTLGVCDDV